MLTNTVKPCTLDIGLLDLACSTNLLTGTVALKKLLYIKCSFRLYIPWFCSSKISDSETCSGGGSGFGWCSCGRRGAGSYSSGFGNVGGPFVCPPFDSVLFFWSLPVQQPMIRMLFSYPAISYNHSTRKCACYFQFCTLNLTALQPTPKSKYRIEKQLAGL